MILLRHASWSVQLPQSLASKQKHSSQEPDITVVKVEQSLANPNIERVQVSANILSN